MTKSDQAVLEKYVYGRVRPHIYAFETGSVPNFLKVGDSYRPVTVRLAEWKKFYPDLQQTFDQEATVDSNVFFRDHAVHSYLRIKLAKRQLTPKELPDGVHFSREFFFDTTSTDVAEALESIRDAYRDGTHGYKFYDARSKLPERPSFQRGENWDLRPNQKRAVDRFVEAVNNDRTHLLMYAVMRFGKTFTALECAKAIDARLVYVVSAKADVKEEWRKVVQSAGNFRSYRFVDSEELLRNNEVIARILEEGKVAVVFVTLQDLQGERVKQKHRELFQNEADLLIVDESHFGARAQQLGQVLRGGANNALEDGTALRREARDTVSHADAEDIIKSLRAKVSLHLSGTPYRILMGNEFEPADIISFVQFADIVGEQRAWDERHLYGSNEGHAFEEWDNPYFGFPEMVRFAFHPNKASRQRMDDLKTSGYSFALSALLEPKSVRKDETHKNHRELIYEAEVLDLLRAIDGSKADRGILALLDNERIQSGELCQHIVMVLPYCASCDAIETLIKRNASKFKHLADYRVINLSGHDMPNEFKNVDNVKRLITAEARNGKKTLTLTVNRMLTGTTVPEWDTMIYLKDTASPQEYDQAIFRLQNQYVTELVDPDSGNTIKYNLKPQTLLVDFSPDRMFRLEEQKALFLDANSEDGGHLGLESRLQQDLQVSPILMMDPQGLTAVTPTNILEHVSDYNANRSITDEARDIPIDFNLLRSKELSRLIDSQAEIGSRSGLHLPPNEGDGEELPPPDQGEEPDDNDAAEVPDRGPTRTVGQDDIEGIRSRKLQTYYQRLLFFALLTEGEVSDLAGIIDASDTPDGERLAKNLGLGRDDMVLFAREMDPFKLAQLDYKIMNISRLSNDPEFEPLERAERALRKFSRISDAEVRTPSWLCDEMINEIPEDELEALVRSGKVFVDIASKTGEFAVSIYSRLTKKLGFRHEDVKNLIYSIPTSPITYEFTRKFYKIVGLPEENVSPTLTSVDLVKPDGTQNLQSWIGEPEVGRNKRRRVKDVKFGAIVGNPPYHVTDGGAQSSAQPIYQDFYYLAKDLNPRYLSLVVPTRWYAGGKPVLKKFREEMLNDGRIRALHDYRRPADVFPETNNRGGICHFLWDSESNANRQVKVITHGLDGNTVSVDRPLAIPGQDVLIRDPFGPEAIEVVTSSSLFVTMEECVLPLRPFGLRSFFSSSEDFHSSPEGLENPVGCYGRGRVLGYIEKDKIPSGYVEKRRNEAGVDLIDQTKLMFPRANNIGTELSDDNLNVFVAGANTICTEAYLVAQLPPAYTEQEALKAAKYLRTRFARYMHSLMKAGQDATAKTFRFTPQLTPALASRLDFEKDLDDQLFDIFDLSKHLRQHIIESIKLMTE